MTSNFFVDHSYSNKAFNRRIKEEHKNYLLEQSKKRNQTKQKKIDNLKAKNTRIKAKVEILADRINCMKDEFEDKTKFENLLISTSDITEEELNKTRRPKKYSGKYLFYWYRYPITIIYKC